MEPNATITKTPYQRVYLLNGAIMLFSRKPKRKRNCTLAKQAYGVSGLTKNGIIAMSSCKSRRPKADDFCCFWF